MITLHARTAHVSTHTNTRAAVVGPRDRLTPEDLNVTERAREIWKAVTDDVALMARIAASPLKWTIYRLRRKDHRSDPLEVLASVVVGLKNLGEPEEFARRLPLFLSQLIDECYAGSAGQVDVRQLDRQELQCEQAQRSLQIERHIDGVATPDELDAEAAEIEREIALEQVRARVLRRAARKMRAGIGTTGTGRPLAIAAG